MDEITVRLNSWNMMRTLVHVLNPFDSSSWLLGCKIGMASALPVLAPRKCERATRLHVRCDSQKATMIAPASCFVFLPAGDPCPVSFLSPFVRNRNRALALA